MNRPVEIVGLLYPVKDVLSGEISHVKTIKKAILLENYAGYGICLSDKLESMILISLAEVSRIAFDQEKLKEFELID